MGSSSTSTSGSSRMKPRASASFCHWPKRHLDAVGPASGRAGCRARRRGGRRRRRPRPGRRRRPPPARRRCRGTSPTPDALPGAQLEAEEVLVRAGQAVPPLVGGHAGQLGAVDEDPPVGRLVELRQQLHERGLAGAVLADDGHHRAGGQVERHVLEHEPVGARVGERHVLERDAVARARSGTGTSASATRAAA